MDTAAVKWGVEPIKTAKYVQQIVPRSDEVSEVVAQRDRDDREVRADGERRIEGEVVVDPNQQHVQRRRQSTSAAL